MLDQLSFSHSSNAVGISDDGNVLVGSTGTSLGLQTVRWNGTSATGLGDLPGGGFSSIALDASADGSTIVGRGESANGFEAFLWRSDLGLGGMVNLKDYLATQSVTGLNGWRDNTVSVFKIVK